MYNGVWMGSNVQDTAKVLIVGESHYKGDKEVTSTEAVLKEHMNLSFFQKIAKSFGYDDCFEFFNKVHFGNYVDELCGIGENNRAAESIRTNNEKYNNELCLYVNEHGIDVVVFFSKLSYMNAPDSTKQDKVVSYATTIGQIGGRNNVMNHCFYKAGVKYKKCSVSLNKALTVYALRHPSGAGGYDERQVYEGIKESGCKELLKLLKQSSCDGRNEKDQVNIFFQLIQES